MLVIVLFAVAALFALALAWRLGVHARGLKAVQISWRSWGALGLGALLTVIGRPLAGFVFISLGLVLAWPQERPHLSRGRSASQELEAARALLGVDPSADALAIRAAYRAKIARAHPDAGGTGAAADALAKARDLLLKTLQ